MMYNSVFYINKHTGKLLKRFDYPKHKVLNKFFWEKMKREELQRLLKLTGLEEWDVKMSDHSGVL